MLREHVKHEASVVNQMTERMRIVFRSGYTEVKFEDLATVITSKGKEIVFLSQPSWPRDQPQCDDRAQNPPWWHATVENLGRMPPPRKPPGLWKFSEENASDNKRKE